MSKSDVREAIMVAARPMIQAAGYNALSFRDVAARVGVKSASVHYHFPTKGDLAAALAGRYADEAKSLLESLSLEPADLSRTLGIYIAAFRAALENDNRMCLCGIMAAEYDALPVDVRRQVDRFTDVNVAWLIKLLSSVTPGNEPDETSDRALAIFASIEGAQLVARGRGDIAVFDRCITSYQSAGLFPKS